MRTHPLRLRLPALALALLACAAPQRGGASSRPDAGAPPRDAPAPRELFAIVPGSTALSVEPGRSTTLAVAVERSPGFARPITVELRGLPGGLEAQPASAGEHDTA